MTSARAPAAKRERAGELDIAGDAPVVADGAPVRVSTRLRAAADAGFERIRGRVISAARAAIDASIALLQRLRKCTGVEAEPEQRHERARPGRRAAGDRAKDEAAVEAIALPKPQRRLRRLLVYLCVMLAAGTGGMALAYDLLAQLLERRANEIEHQDAKLKKYSKSLAALKQYLEQAQAKQAEAETRLAEGEKKLLELQAKRPAAQTQLASAAAGRASDPQRQGDAAGGRSAARGGWTKSVDCTLGRGDVRSVLDGCIAAMNRK